MSAEIKDQVEKCSVCAEFQAQNASQPMQSHQIPDRPWSKIATDLFTLHSRNYITVVDYFSDFLEVSELQDTTSTSAIQALKELFQTMDPSSAAKSFMSSPSPGNSIMSHLHLTIQRVMVKQNRL